MWLGIVLIFFMLFIIYFTNLHYRFLTSIIITFLVGFVIFQLTNGFFDQYEMSKGVRVLLNRSLLIIIIASLFLTHLFYKKEFTFFNRKPNWSHRISLPFHSIKIAHFLLIGLVINVAIFTPFIAQRDLNDISSLLFFCVVFSIINSVFEELIWRGILLSSIAEHASVFYAVFITSLGFGLQHLAIGMPFSISLLFSIGGLFYAFVVLKTNSIYPAILFHICINIGMVLSGMIL